MSTIDSKDQATPAKPMGEVTAEERREMDWAAYSENRNVIHITYAIDRLFLGEGDTKPWEAMQLWESIWCLARLAHEKAKRVEAILEGQGSDGSTE